MLGLSLLAATPVLATATRYQAPTNAGAVPAEASTLSTSPARLTAGPEKLPGKRASSTRSTAAAAQMPGVPIRLRIPALGVQAPIVAVRAAADGTLGVPDDAKAVGWWAGGAMPRDAVGSVVLDGHVDTVRSGAGALFHLADLALGAEVVVSTSTGDVRYVVVARRVYAKTGLPSQVFARQGPPRLVLLTCGGPFDARTHHYRDNVVAYATPITGKEQL